MLEKGGARKEKSATSRTALAMQNMQTRVASVDLAMARETSHTRGACCVVENPERNQIKLNDFYFIRYGVEEIKLFTLRTHGLG